MRKGFTLIEIIIVVLIMSLFAGFGINTYTKQIQSKQFDADVDAFVSTIHLVRSKAINRDLSILPSCKNFIRYYIRTRPSANPDEYRRGFDCNPPPSGSRYRTWGDTQLNASRIIAPPADTTISFYPPLGCTNSTCDASNITVTFKNFPENNCKEVVINRLGNPTVTEIACP